MMDMPMNPLPMLVYVVMGIDDRECDRLLAVCLTYQDAKNYLTRCKMETEYFDMWIEKHPVVD
jgi:hypothetical protein